MLDNIKFYFKNFSNKYLVVTLLVAVLCPILALSYSNFIVETESYNTSEMIIGNLIYSMKINNESVTSTTVNANSEKEIVMEITNLNAVTSKYMLIYENNANVRVKYASDENEPAIGAVSTTRTFTILITNTSNENTTVVFSIAGGYNHNDEEEIIIPDGYTSVPNSYMKFDFEAVALFINNVRVESLLTNKKYFLDSYTCSHGEVVTYDTNSRAMTIVPMDNQTKCQLYFGEVSLTLAETLNYPSALTDASIDFSQASGTTNGLGLYYTSDLTKTQNGVRVYYFRGDVDNNNVIFAGMCWSIMRTDENGNIRLLYNGLPTDNTCPVTGTAPGINSGTAYPLSWTIADNSYVGYMTGLANQCGSSFCKGTTKSTSYSQAHANNYNSNAKSIVDNWYASNIISQGTTVTSRIKNSIYCGDRKLSSGVGYGINTTTYMSNVRRTNNTPQYKCDQTNDQFTLTVANGGTAGYGNNALTYPVAMTNRDESVYAGGTIVSSGDKVFFARSTMYWAMDAGMYDGGWGAAYLSLISQLGVAVWSSGYIQYPIYPAITVDSTLLVKSGDGTYALPYRLQ